MVTNKIFNSGIAPLAFLKGEGRMRHIDIKSLAIEEPTVRDLDSVRAEGSFYIEIDLGDLPYTDFSICIAYEEDSVLTIKDGFVKKISLTTESKDSLKEVHFVGRVELVSKNKTYYLKAQPEDSNIFNRVTRAKRVLRCARNKINNGSL